MTYTGSNFFSGLSESIGVPIYTVCVSYIIKKL